MDSSPPPENLLTGVPSGSVPPQTQPSRKRKRAPAAASSPAPSDSASTPAASTPNAPTNDSLVTRGDLSSRPILTISRGPIFVPCTDGPSAEYFKTDLVGINRVGFRYVPAGINPPGRATPCRTIESNPTSYRISWEDRSPFIKVMRDGLGLAGSSGFRSARCNAPIREGKWYLEVKIVHGGGERVQLNGSSEEGGNGNGGTANKVKREGAHVRLGWGRREASLNGPVGLDGYSYGYRDKSGEKVTLSRPRPYGKPFASGDVIGMYISLPPRRVANPKDPHDPAHIRRERIPIDLKGQEVFEILEYPQSKEMAALVDYSGKSTQSSSVPSTSNKKSGPNAGKPPETTTSSSPTKPQQPLRPLPTLGAESKIAFFVNGECQGVAFQDLYDYLQLRQPKDKIQKAREKRRAKEGVKEHRENPFDDGWLGYYPFISLFNDASVHINPGPDFEHPPPPDVDALLEGKDPLALPVKTEASGPTQRGMDGGADIDVKPTRTWRPACERYAEFMQEQWDLDALEEEEAKVELTRWQETTKREEEKAEQRRKKRREADAKRRAKKAIEAEAKKREALGLLPREDMVGGAVTLSQLNVPGVGIGVGAFAGGYASSAYPSPSPLRHSTAAYDLDREIEAAALESERNSTAPRERSTTSEPQEHSHYGERVEEDGMAIDQVDQREEEEELEPGGTMIHGMGIKAEVPDGHSPAPTAGSYIGLGGSEYAGSEFQEDEEREQEEGVDAYPEVEEGEEEEEGEFSVRRVRPGVEYVREEEEEEEEER
ncbi:hypothetical protein P691DRAFT_805137 [Macrolepiota fuliginosa MF-IS2]|uniref:B30.2/SPRY domain-containing protein n=1 Tax=Macrolepiota fuliginosa MF-IS2 TaxID=1400762 RepID=A0A9P5XMG5_9AGAR|nr:hypothetical protein P691DRAFT_805137 [Macrolepiota fuliginosa MF-IS2]